MDKTAIAEAITEARRTGRQTDLEWPDPAPTMADAMEIQALVFAKFASPGIGWKVGATNEAAQAGFGIKAPFYGPMAKAGLLDDGAAIAKSACVGAVEPEYAFRMARDFPADGEEVNAVNAASAVAHVHIAIEVIGRCIGSAAYQNGMGVAMDFGGNAAFVVGAQIDKWREQDLVTTPVEAMVDGAVVQTGNGEPVMGDPINSLVWMAQQLGAKGQCLKAGDWVSTGTCTPPVPAEAGKTVSARFGTFGEVSVRFT